MQSYEHGGDIYRNHVRVDFSVNTNPLGMPAAVLAALRENLDACEKYPDPHCEKLRQAIARFEGVPEPHIVCGAGAADLIYRLVFAQQPKKVLVCAPTFSEYERAVWISGGQVVYHALREADGFALTERILDDMTADIDMVFLCNPNNPTGKLADTGVLKSVADKCLKNGATCVLDECFLPFTHGESLKNLPHVVILKAFTKIYSMAGLRLGYMLCGDSDVINAVRDRTQTWGVSSLAQIAGIAVLEDCSGWIEQTLKLVETEREYLTTQLRGMGLKVYDSDASFILFRAEKSLYAPLLKRGFLVRSCANFNELGEDYTRIAVKLREENAALITEIGRIV
ncbi:MAG: aminotransferase class I/II-fold pyridoxal phosphate-dependent enzyme [Oscillospiraceae bacterium]|nr:aminotransferase class I/II-fold pyridoxal phosphate-dependent enzyme [Oscillospiraceae bacterium]